MNFFGMRTEFDRIQRTLNGDTFDDFRDDWLNTSWAKIAEMFVIPALKRNVSFDAVEDQAKYLFPLDYSTEVFLYYTQNSTAQRLDPAPQDVLALQYEKRSGNMGTVLYYDLCEPVGSDYAERTCTITNNSATVLCTAAAALDADKWIRFDPFTSGSTTYDPGDYGYLITAVTAGVSYTLDRAYRGPGGSTTGRVRPAEQQQFIVYGYPTADKTDAFQLTYYARPRRLYNNADVPEWPNMSEPIVYMALSLMYDYLQQKELAGTWFGRSVSRITNLKNRSKHNQVLITDLTVGSVSGRQTGPRGVRINTGSRRY